MKNKKTGTDMTKAQTLMGVNSLQKSVPVSSYLKYFCLFFIFSLFSLCLVSSLPDDLKNSIDIIYPQTIIINDSELNVNDSQYLGGIPASSYSVNGNCPAGYVVQNTTHSGVQCVLMTTATNTSGFLWVNGSNSASTMVFNYSFFDAVGSIRMGNTSTLQWGVNAMLNVLVSGGIVTGGYVAGRETWSGNATSFIRQFTNLTGGFIDMSTAGQSTELYFLDNITATQSLTTNKKAYILGNQICNATSCFTLQELNTTGSSGGMDYTNVALTNQSNDFNGSINSDTLTIADSSKVWSQNEEAFTIYSGYNTGYNDKTFTYMPYGDTPFGTGGKMIIGWDGVDYATFDLGDYVNIGRAGHDISFTVNEGGTFSEKLKILGNTGNTGAVTIDGGRIDATNVFATTELRAGSATDYSSLGQPANPLEMGFYEASTRKFVFGYDVNADRATAYSDSLGMGIHFFDGVGMAIGSGVNDYGSNVMLFPAGGNVETTGNLLSFTGTPNFKMGSITGNSGLEMSGITTDSWSVMRMFPNGVGASTFEFYGTDFGADQTNYERARWDYGYVNDGFTTVTEAGGSGTTKPIYWNINGATNVMELTADGRLIIDNSGTLADDTTSMLQVAGNIDAVSYSTSGTAGYIIPSGAMYCTATTPETINGSSYDLCTTWVTV